MVVRRTRLAVVGWGVGFAVSIALTARAQEGCERFLVAEGAGVDEAWREAIGSLRAELGRSPPGECEEVRLSIEVDAGVGRVVAMRADGQSATRPVPAPDALVPIALGLVASIPPEPQALVLVRPPFAPPRDLRPTFEPPAALDPSALRVDVALTTGSRIGGPTSVLMADLELRTDFRWGAFFLFPALRYAPVGERLVGAIPGFTYDELALALGAGVRATAGGAAFDFALVPEMAFASEKSSAPDEEHKSEVASELRLGASVRAVLPFGKTVRPALAFDAEGAPFQLGSGLRVDPKLPAIPTWTLGLRAGAVADLF